MKLGDITKFGTYEEVLENLEELKSALNKYAKEIPVKPIDDFAGFALTKLISYSIIQIERLILYVQFPIEVHALIARNLFECYLICVYIISDPLKAKEFLTQKSGDELEIYDGILSLKHLGNTKDIENPIMERIQHIKNTLQKHNIVLTTHWTVGMLAKQTGNKDEYDAFFKLYSKYVHPSSWIINGGLNEYDNSTYRNIFLLQSQYYISHIMKIAVDYIEQKKPTPLCLSLERYQ